MKCKTPPAVVLTLMVAAASRAGDVKVLTSALLYETGQAAPVVELRSRSDDGSLWRFAVEGWTLSATRERPMSRQWAWFATLSATPHNAHSSERIYRDGVRAHDLEFSDAAYSIRGGVRLSESDRASTEISAVVVREVIGDDATAELREPWRTPQVGMQLIHRLRFVTAEDPFTGRIHGVAITANAEGFGGGRAWARGALTEEGGWPLHRFHLRESVALMTSSHLDDVSAFLAGGSWDALRTTAVYGTRYAEFRVTRGAIGSAGADYSITPSWELGFRASVLRAPALHKTGAMLQLTHKVGGLQLSAGAGKSDGRSTIIASVGGSLFR
jgi:hypothetical protein